MGIVAEGSAVGIDVKALVVDTVAPGSDRTVELGRIIVVVVVAKSGLVDLRMPG